MNQLNLQVLRHNAYRVLGLTAGASQADIDSAARMMRLWENETPPPTANDAPWLGIVPRAPKDIEFAVMRLSGPDTRALERVFWFCGAPPAGAPSRRILADEPEPAAALQAHDRTLLRLCLALDSDAAAGTLTQWRALLPQLRALSMRDEYFDWMLELERNAEFEKPASPEELRRTQSHLAEAACATLVSLADRYLREDSFLSAGEIIDILHESSDGASGPALDAEKLIIEHMDDALTGKCNEYREDIDRAWKTMNATVLRGSCESTLSKCEQRLQPLMQTLLRWSPGDELRETRLRSQIADVYIHVSKAFEACMDFPAARRALLRSADVARGTTAEPQIEQRVKELADVKGRSPEQASGGGKRRSMRFGLLLAGVLLSLALRLIFMTGAPPRSVDFPTDQLPRANPQKVEQLNRIIEQYRTATNPATRPYMGEAIRRLAGLPPESQPASQPSRLSLTPALPAGPEVPHSQTRPALPNPLRLGSP